jgi:hypothetical protein
MSQVLKAGRLERRAREIVENLNGSWGRGKGMCVCPAHDDRSPSLSVTLGRTAILFHCFAGCSNEEVIAALGRRGVRARDLFDGGGAALAEPQPRQEGPDRNARRVWAVSARLRDSLAERYLSGRSIREFSAELRFDNQTPLGPRDRVRFLPAMIAAVRTDLGVIAVHRTFLDPEGGGLARFQQPRRALGSLGTGAVRLAPPRDGVLGLAEGIERCRRCSSFGFPAGLRSATSASVWSPSPTECASFTSFWITTPGAIWPRRERARLTSAKIGALCRTGRTGSVSTGTTSFKSGRLSEDDPMKRGGGFGPDESRRTALGLVRRFPCSLLPLSLCPFPLNRWCSRQPANSPLG